MLLKEVIDNTNELKPNSYKNSQLAAWVSELEARVMTDVLLLSFTTPDVRERFRAAKEAALRGNYKPLSAIGIKIYPAAKENTVELARALREYEDTIKASYYEGDISLLRQYADCDDYLKTLSRERQYSKYFWDDNYPLDSGYAGDDRERELLVKYPHDNIYFEYLSAKIDLANGDYGKYQIDYAVFEDTLSRLQAFISATLTPANRKALEGGYYLKGDKGDKGEPVEYFISFDVGENGRLVYSAIEEEAGGFDFEISSEGHLFVNA